MRRTAGLLFVFAAAVLLVCAGAATAQNPAHNHIGHVMDAWRDTPEGVGLLPAAIAEAQVAARHAELAASDTGNLDNIKRHTAHVLHAIDPEQIENGPGAGYGVKQGAAGAAQHINAAAGAEGASDAVKTHANHVATSANNTVARVDQMVSLAQRIASSSSASDAGTLVTQLNELAQALLAGVDANGDGRVGWQQGEGGLTVAETHANLMKQAEGL